MIYVLYDWTKQEILLVTRDREKVYKERSKYKIDDIHVLAIDEEKLNERRI